MFYKNFSSNVKKNSTRLLCKIWYRTLFHCVSSRYRQTCDTTIHAIELLRSCDLAVFVIDSCLIEIKENRHRSRPPASDRSWDDSGSHNPISRLDPMSLNYFACCCAIRQVGYTGYRYIAGFQFTIKLVDRYLNPE